MSIRILDRCQRADNGRLRDPIDRRGDLGLGRRFGG